MLRVLLVAGADIVFINCRIEVRVEGGGAWEEAGNMGNGNGV